MLRLVFFVPSSKVPLADHCSLVQVVGRKTIWLAPPDFYEEMYPYDASMSDTRRPQSSASERTTAHSSSSSPPSSRSASALSDLTRSSNGFTTSDSRTRRHHPEEFVAPSDSTGMLGNTSRVPIFEPPPDAKNQFPLFFSHVASKAYSAILEPGDMLVFPPGWWHAMRSEETSASVSMWF